MAKANSYGLIKVHIMENSLRTIFTGKVNINGQMGEFIQENG